MKRGGPTAFWQHLRRVEGRFRRIRLFRHMERLPPAGINALGGRAEMGLVCGLALNRKFSLEMLRVNSTHTYE